MNPRYDPSLPGIFQSTGYYSSPSHQFFQQSYEISSWSGSQIQATISPRVDHDLPTRYAPIPVSCPANGANGDGYYYSWSAAPTPTLYSGSNGGSLQRANANHGSVGRSALIGSARGAKLRSRS